MIERISDIGNIRKQNEDSYGILEDVNYNVFLICDGMGGHNAGEVASQLAMEAVVETIKKCFEDNLPDMVLTKAFYTANEWVYKKSLESKRSNRYAFRYQVSGEGHGNHRYLCFVL